MQTTSSVATLLEVLQDFADEIAGSLNPDVDWAWRPASAEWSLTEVMCHLRDVEREVHQARFRAILESETPFLPGVSSNEWALPRGYRQQNGMHACSAFLDARAGTINLLQSLDEEAWQRQGNHSFFGLTTMHELLNLVTKHDNIHRQQIHSLLAQGK